MLENNISCAIKLFVLGNFAVGKTSLINKFVYNKFREIYLPTIGFDCAAKNIILPNEKKVKISFHDTAGQERYRSIAFNLINSANGVILTYDITNRETFNAIPEWINNIRDYKGEDFPVALIGNKCDLEEEREVKTIEGKELARKYGFLFFETSSKKGNNVQESILELALNIFEQKKKEGKIKEKNEEKNEKKIEKEKDKKIILKIFKMPRRKKCKC